LRFSTVLFDLDGTLTDPGEGIAKSILAALREVGLPEPSPRELRLCVGPPLQQSFIELGATPGQVPHLIEIYRKRYRETGMFENLVYPEIPDLLAELRSHGCQLLVATSKPTPFAEAILDHFRLRQYFLEVYASGLDGSLSEKRSLIAHIRASAALTPSESALVGDREFDIAAARAESLFSVGALWGYGSRSELVAAGADALASSPSGVLDALNGRADPLQKPR
jgi:phosphoglycolate phosphatase